MESTQLNTDLAKKRREYTLNKLSENQIFQNPFDQFSLWLKQAEESKLTDHNAMTLATVNTSGQPSARIVLLKHLDKRGLCFFTDYSSRKGEDLTANPFAALSFFWPELERQVRFEGEIEKLTSKENDQYFNDRPVDSQISAIISHQSKIISSRVELENKIAELTQRVVKEPSLLKRPERWGGYRFLAKKIEFWQGRPSRLHDRLLFTKEKDNWIIKRLAP